MILTEDDLYRNSSQYKHWSFTPTQLALLRQKTNIQACERVKANVARQRAQRAAAALDGNNSASDSSRANTPALENGNGNGNASANGTGDNTPVKLDKEVDCLTVAEEMRLVDKFSEMVLELATFVGMPADVTATAIQFLRRFYIYNSPMTYDATIVSKTITFIACKTDNHNITLDQYISKLGKVTREQILAPEYVIVQALRFNFEVRHPFRGLKGVHLEIGEILSGKYQGMPFDSRTSEERKQTMLKLPKTANGKEEPMTEREFTKRLEYDYAFASKILKTTAQLTDAYFLYTPPQILFAAHLLADEPLTLFYLSLKILSSSPIYAKTLSAIRACASMLSSHQSYNAGSVSPEEKEAQDAKTKKEISALMKKLKQCRDPDKIDLVKLNQAQKRDAIAADGAGLEESKAKRRKIAREAAEKEADDFWGPELNKK